MPSGGSDKIPVTLVSKLPDLYAFFITLPAYCKLLMLRRVVPSDVSERYDVYHAMRSGQPRMCCSLVTLHRFSSCKT
jgi:hypothetical protein